PSIPKGGQNRLCHLNSVNLHSLNLPARRRPSLVAEDVQNPTLINLSHTGCTAPADADNPPPDFSWRRNQISDQEILAYEEMEDERLRRLGIDPDGDPIEIMVKIFRLGKRHSPVA
ncbi:MAG: hypothetical protein ACRD6B_08680, partial [Bryobacteraceae bacterium]